MDHAVVEGAELDGLPIRCQLAAEQLDATVALQLKQRVEQGFGEVAPLVLSRVAQIVGTVGREMATTVPNWCSDDHAALDQAA